jgi:hypothetical protein
MKTFIGILLIVTILGFVAMPSRAGTDADPDISKKIAAILTECQKIKPGMNRAALTNAFNGVITDGMVPRDTFYQHQTFIYRGCPFIQVDVDFATSESKQQRPTDTIVKISRPYLEWIPVTD